MAHACCWLLLTALVAHGAALACSPVPTPISGWRGQALARYWATRPCAPEWAARAGERGEVACYRVAPAGRLPPEALAQEILGLPLSQVQVRQPSRVQRRFTAPASKERGQQVLDVWDRSGQGWFVNFSREPTVREQLEDQLRPLLASAARLPRPPHPWLGWMLGDGRQDCARFGGLDARLVQSCTVRQVEASVENFSMGRRERRSLPLAEFTVRPGVSLGSWLKPGRPYAAYPAASCAETTLPGIRLDSYQAIWLIY